MIKDTTPINAHTVLRTILSACTLLMLIAAAAGVASAMPPVPYFNQCDSRWAGDQLGGDGPTICGMGCALTSAAMVMAYYGVDTDPKRLNDAIGRGGYDAGYNIYWSAVRNACHDENNQIEYDPGTVDYDETVLNSSLDAGRPVIVHVYCPGYGGYWGGHFVVVTGRSDEAYYINDPGFSTRSTLDDYPTRYGMRIFSGNPPVERVNTPLAGDWNGNGTDTTGIYNYTTAEFSLDSGLNIKFGLSGDIPITGDWNGDGYGTIGVFRPSTAQFFLDYDNDGISDMNATFGVIGDIPVAGDWDGDGDDNIGVFRQNHSDSGLTMFFLDFDNSGSADLSVAFGEPDDLPVIGDWDGDGDDNIGLYRPGSTTSVFYLDIDNDGGIADIVTPEYGDLGDIPIAGDWDGDSDDNIGVYRPGTGEFFVNATLPEVLLSKMIYVDDDFSDNPSEHKWDTIQEGVDDAADGDTVIVYAGTYVENVDVDKSITLQGAGADLVTVRAADAGDHVFEVTVDRVNISGFTVTGATDYYTSGIYLDDADYCNISDTNALDNYYGIGIESCNNTLTNNIFINDGLVIEGYWNVVENNTVNGKPLVYLEDASNFTIQNAGQVILVNCTNITAESLNLYNASVGVHLLITDNCKITNNTVSNNAFGILIDCSSNNTLTDNTASNNYGGIYLYFSSNNMLIGNIANSNNDYGVELYGSSNNTLQSNAVSDNYRGICLSSSSNNTLRNNMMSGNMYNFGVYAGDPPHLSDYTHDIDTNNIVDGKPIYYWVNQQDNQIIGNAGFVGVVNSTNITVRDLTLTNNTQGVLFAYTENSRIENVSTSDDWWGIYLHSSSNNMLAGNTVSGNFRGVGLSSSSNNNTLYHNDLINNTGTNAYDSCTNTWDSGSAGNYYSDYTGTDPDGDGIGNDPHLIPGGDSIDRFPLMQPWTGGTSPKGDLNHDDRITPADAAIALAIAAGGSASCDASDAWTHADVSGDGRVTSLDALMILQAACGAIEL